MISPLTNDSPTAETTEATSQANYPQIITSILSGQTSSSQGEFTESDLLFSSFSNQFIFSHSKVSKESHPINSTKNGLLNGKMNSESRGVKNQKLVAPDTTAVSGMNSGVGTQKVSPVTPTEIIELCSP